MKKWHAFLILTLIINGVLNAQQVSIPDPQFLSALIEAGVDTDRNGTVELEEASSVKCLDISDKNIHDLKCKENPWVF